jgi:hypothetical protein
MLKAYRFTLTMPAWVTVDVNGRVDPSVSGSTSPPARATNFRRQNSLALADPDHLVVISARLPLITVTRKRSNSSPYYLIARVAPLANVAKARKPVPRGFSGSCWAASPVRGLAWWSPTNAATATRRRLSGHQYRKHHLSALARLAEAGKPVPGPCEQLRGVCAEPNPENGKKDVV